MALTTRIHTMKPDERGDTLDRLAIERANLPTAVDYERVRNVSETTTLLGVIVAVAINPSGPDHLIVRPINPGLRIHSIPATTIVRIYNPRTREVYAGPALPPEPDPQDD